MKEKDFYAITDLEARLKDVERLQDCEGMPDKLKTKARERALSLYPILENCLNLGIISPEQNYEILILLDSYHKPQIIGRKFVISKPVIDYLSNITNETSVEILPYVDFHPIAKNIREILQTVIKEKFGYEQKSE